MTWNGEPIVIRTPSYKALLYLAALLSVAGSLGTTVYLEMQRNAKMDSVIGSLSVLPALQQQVATMVQQSSDRERRIASLEAARTGDTQRYETLMTSLAGLSAQAQAIAAAQAEAAQREDNLLRAVTGQEYQDARGRKVR